MSICLFVCLSSLISQTTVLMEMKCWGKTPLGLRIAKKEYIRLMSWESWELKMIEIQQAALLLDLIPFWQFLLVAINRCPAHFIAFVQHNGGGNPLKLSWKWNQHKTVYIWPFSVENIAIESLYFYERAVNKGGRWPYIDILQSRATYIHFSYSRPCCYATRSICFSKRTRRNIYLVSGCANIECISAVLLEFVGGSIQRVVS